MGEWSVLKTGYSKKGLCGTNKLLLGAGFVAWSS